MAGLVKTQSQGRPLHFVAWLIGERVVRGSVTVIALAAVARHLTPSGFGVLNFSNTVVGLAIPLAQLGIDSILVRELVKNPSKTGSLLGTSFVLRLAAGAVFAALVVAASHFSRVIGAAQPALGPMSFIILAQAGEVADCWFRSRVQSRAVVVIRGSVIIVGAGVKLILVAAGAGLVAFAWVYTVEALAFVTGLIVYSRRAKDHTPPWTFDGGIAWALFREGWGFALAGFLGALAVRVDQIAVTGMMGDAPAGLYFGALRLMELPILVATSTAASLFPGLAIADDDPIMHARLETIFGMMSAIAWVTAIGATITGPWLIPALLGEAYRAAWPVFAIQGWASLFFFSGLVRANYLALRKAPVTQALSAALSLGVQVLFLIMLVPRFGISGAAWAFLLTQLLSAWIVPFALPPLRPCVGPQARGLFAPWRPSSWREFLVVAGGQS
jgi:O-antigen/teichoic acid export membrane protein